MLVMVVPIVEEPFKIRTEARVVVGPDLCEFIVNLSLLGLVHGVTRHNRVFCGAAMLVVGDLAAKDTMRATRHQVTPVFVLESGPPPPPPPPRRHLQLLFWGHHVTLE